MDTRTEEDTLLTRALAANAAFSGLSGLVLLALFPDLLTTAGERTVGAVAVVVAALAAAQLLGLRRRVARSRDDGPRPGASRTVSEEPAGPGGRPSP